MEFTMEIQTVEELKAQVARLEQERDHWKVKAGEQHENTSANDKSIHTVDERTVDKPMSHISELATGIDDPKMNFSISSAGNNPLPQITRLVTQSSTPENFKHAESGPEVPNVYRVVSDESNDGDNVDRPALNINNSSGSAENPSIIDTYPFMEEFPNGEWWTRLDEEDGPSRSLDFGLDGYTASLNMGHELLQMTAPHSEFGLAYARGSFSDNPDAILARAQRTVGGKSTFGLKWLQGPMSVSLDQDPHVPRSPSYRQGTLLYHGLLNFRWPYKKHAMYRAGIIPSSANVASLSFVKDHMVYQILRFEAGNLASLPPEVPPDSAPLKNRRVAGESINPSQGAPWILSPPPPRPRLINVSEPTVNVQIGGTLRLGFSSCSNDPSDYAVKHNSEMISLRRPEEDQILGMQLFINGKNSTPAPLSSYDSESLKEYHVLVKTVVPLEIGKPTVVVARSALGSGSENALRLPLPTNEELAQYLGARMSSGNATDRVWGSRIDLNADIDDDDFCASASCLEQILGVTSVPMRWIADPVPPPSTQRPPLSTALPAQIVERTVLTKEELVSLANTPNLANAVGNERRSSRQFEVKDTETIDPSTPATDSIPTDPSREPSIVETQVHATKQTSVLSGKSCSSGDHSDAQLRHSIALGLLAVEGSSSELNGHMTIPKIPQPTSDQPQPPSEHLEIPLNPSPPTQNKSPHSPFFSAQPQEASIGFNTPQFRPPSIPSLSSLPGRHLGTEDPDMGIALLCGILGNQYVDLQKSFWQIRYLVKAYTFLVILEKSSPSEPTDTDRNSSSLEDLASLEKVRTSYLDRIKFHIHHALVWITLAKVKYGFHCSPAVAPYNIDTFRQGFAIQDSEDDRVLYPPIAIWYVMKNCEEALPRSFIVTLAARFHDLRDQDIGEVDITRSDHDPKLAMLMWYRYSCLAQIDQELSKYPDLDEVPRVMNGIASKAQTWQKNAEKAMAISRRAAIDSYSDHDESVDRLAFLGLELGLVPERDRKQPSSCISLARRKILDRKPTRKLNPGIPLFGNDGSIRVSTSAPWELTCVNHHTRLELWKDPELEQGLDLARQDCLRFMSTNFIFICSWDTSKHNLAALYWDLDASCVICSTFLDMRGRNKSLEPAQASSPTISPTHELSMPHRRLSIAVATDEPVDSHHSDVQRPIIESHNKRDDAEDLIADLLRRQIERQDIMIQVLSQTGDTADSAFEFDWARCQPPSILHPDSWVQSLDDTPELFRSPQTRTIQLRNEVKRYLSDIPGRVFNAISTVLTVDAPDWTADNTPTKFLPDELLYISVYDIGMTDEDTYFEQRLQGRLEPLKAVEIAGGPRYGMEFNLLFSRGKPEQNLSLWNAYLSGLLDGTLPEFEKLPDLAKGRYMGLAPWLKNAASDKSALIAVKNQVQKSLLTLLNDSLVDCNARNRIFFIQRCSPSIVRAFIYMWHPQSIDTFDDHFRNTSNFLDAKSETWTTSITISYWGFKKNVGTNEKLFHEPRDSAPFPPKMVSLYQKARSTKRSKRHSDKPASKFPAPGKHVQEGASSIVISGDKSGRWWICSFMSSSFPEGVMRATMNDARDTMTKFVHQPSSGRCLVFLAFLGALCENLALEYEDILDELTLAINLGREVLKRGLDWTHAEDAIQRLKSMLWALEALRIFDDRLGESLDKVKEAKDKMWTYLSHGPGRRQDQLERQCQILLEEFDKRHGRLISVHIKIEQKINQISRYREGISAVSNLEDTHTALKQNDTIRILTYITIAYLPLSLIAAIFSMSIVTDSGWGPKLFGGLVVIFFVSTLLLAKSLGFIIRTWDRLVKITRTKLGLHDPLKLGDIMDQAEEVLKEKEEEAPKKEKEKDTVTSSSQPKWPMEYVRNLRNRKKTPKAQEASVQPEED